MLSKPDFLEATRRFKNKKLNGHERQRYHALLLVTKGNSSRGEVLDSCSRSSLSGYLPQHVGRHAAAPDAAEGRCDVPALAMFLLISEGSCCILLSVTERSYEQAARSYSWHA